MCLGQRNVEKKHLSFPPPRELLPGPPHPLPVPLSPLPPPPLPQGPLTSYQPTSPSYRKQCGRVEAQ